MTTEAVPPSEPESLAGAEADARTQRFRFRRVGWLALGWTCVGLGAVGAFLPLLPTTPFLLLAAFCFDRCSPRLHRWLANNAYLGAYLAHYRAGGGVPARIKAVSLAFLWGMLALSAYWSARPWVWGLLAVVGVAVTVHILCLRPGRPRRDGEGA